MFFYLNHYLYNKCEFIFSFLVVFLCSLFLFLSFSLSSSLFGIESPINQTKEVLVSVSPHKFFVEKIAGDTVKVRLLVPAGTSSHTFEPSPKQMLEAAKADAWFFIGEFFENRAMQAFKSYNQNMRFIDLRKDLSLITVDANGKHQGCSCHGHKAGQADLHIWLSPRLAKIQAKTIANALIELYPENQKLYLSNLNLFLSELEELDQEITKILAPLKQRIIMVSHPAYAYFVRDYDLSQLPIEFEGKDPSPKQLTNVMNEAKNANIKTIFIQLQYNNKGAYLIAKSIGARVVILDPYSENYIETMRAIARSFAEQNQ